VNDHYLTSKYDEVQRIDFSGTIWFGASTIAAALPITGLLSTGWRPADLPAPAAVAWWLGAAITTFGLAALAWSGCPVIGGTLDHDERVKSISIRVGLSSFGIGAVTALLAIMLSPA
jgi:hypothetical protein